MSQVDREQTVISKQTQRSALTNGSALFLDGDGRSAHARRFRDIIEGVESDLGGPDGLSTAQRSIIRKAAALDVAIEATVSRIGKGDSLDATEVEKMNSSMGTLLRLYSALGLDRKAKDVTPTLEDLIKPAPMRVVR